ncbi:MAG: cell envelope integrity protein TolA [Gammaproteobacteria bacterium]|nr:cell envelope integrity protein TolA [Gammaproteobacteria bacterium]
MKINYKSSLMYSFLLHLLVLNFFFLNLTFFSRTNYVTESSVMKAALVEIPKPVVKAANIKKEISFAKEEKKIQPMHELPKPKPEEKVPDPQAIKIENKKILKEKPKPVEKMTPEKPVLKPVLVEKTARVKTPKAQKNMEEKLWAQQLADEDKQLTEAKAQQAQGVINKYNALILQAIREQWVLPENYPAELNCELLISLKAGGGVQDVQLTKSSGNEGFDRSARAAVYKASPLPVPTDVELFNQMKEINLVVRP